MRVWRASSGPGREPFFPQEHRPGEAAQVDFTWMNELAITIRGDVGRCAITTQNPETGTPDLDTLRTISAYRGFTTSEKGERHIPFGVFGEVIEPGRVTKGDTVALAEPR